MLEKNNWQASNARATRNVLRLLGWAASSLNFASNTARQKAKRYVVMLVVLSVARRRSEQQFWVHVTVNRSRLRTVRHHHGHVHLTYSAFS